MESLWIVLRGGCLHFEGGGGFGGRTCWTQARRHHLGGERHTLPGGDPRGGPQSEFLLSFSESETFPRSRNRVSSAMALRLQFQFYRECTTKLFFLFFSSLLENIYDVIRLRIFMRSRDMFLFQLYIPLLIFTFSMWNYFWNQLDIFDFIERIFFDNYFKNKYW